MKSNISQETVKINKEILNKTIEHLINFEYQLPDYYTGIFKMLNCKIEPHIFNCKILNNQLTIDGNTIINLIYLDEEGGNIKSIQKNIAFSKTEKLEELADNSAVSCQIKSNNANCRIINSKKIEIKSTLTILINIQNQAEETIITDVNEKGVQLNKDKISVITNKIWANQQFNISEKIELDSAAKNIIDIAITPITESFKIIANKLITKGKANISVLYSCKDSEKLATKETAIPLNQIIDIPGIDENFTCSAKSEISSIDADILQDGTSLNVEATIAVNCYGYLSKNIEIVTDAFSTENEIKLSTKNFESSSIAATIDENIFLSETIPNVNFSKIYSIYAKIVNLTSEQIKNKLEFKATLNIFALGLNSEETIETLKKSIPIKFNIGSNIKNINQSISADIIISKIEPSVSDDKNLKLKIDAQLRGLINSNEKISIISDISLNEAKAKVKSKTALTLFYPKVGDSIWKIAKKFGTSPKSILETNNLDDLTIHEETMLLIPII